MSPTGNTRRGPMSRRSASSNTAVDGCRRPNRGKPDGTTNGPVSQQETDGTSRVSSASRRVMNMETLRANNYSTPQELRIMNTFTSDEWSARPYFGPTVNAKSAKRVSDGTVVGLSGARTDSPSSRRLFPRAGRDGSNPNAPDENASRDSNWIDKQSTGARATCKTSDRRAVLRSRDGKPDDANETFTRARSAGHGGRCSGERAEERDTVPPERDPSASVSGLSSASASRLSSAGERVTEEFVRHFNPDDSDSNFDSSSSSSSSRDTSVMVRTMRRPNESSSRECRRTTEKPTDDDGPAALEAAYRRLIFDKAKESLAKHLIEGLYQVSKRYRHDPFGCLGRWLLIRADIRDEDRIEHEPTDSRLQTPR